MERPKRQLLSASVCFALLRYASVIILRRSAFVHKPVYQTAKPALQQPIKHRPSPPSCRPAAARASALLPRGRCSRPCCPGAGQGATTMAVQPVVTSHTKKEQNPPTLLDRSRTL